MIDSIQALADHIGARPTEESLSRRVYKSTECGAYLVMVPPRRVRDGGERMEHWEAVLRRRQDGAHLLQARILGGSWSTDPPEDIARYLLLEQRDGALWLDDLDHEILDSLEVCDEILAVSREGADVRIVFVLPVCSWRQHRGGVVLGSIVEGSDVEPLVTPIELEFPFTVDAWDAAIADIERDADYHWQRINGLCSGEKLLKFWRGVR